MFVSVRRLTQELNVLGCEINITGLNDEYSAFDSAAWTPLVPHLVNRKLPKAIGYSPEFNTHLNQIKPDLIHCHGLWQYFNLATMKWANQNNCPRIISTRGMLEPWALNYRAWKKKLIWYLWEKSSLSTATILHATSTVEAQNLRELGFTVPIAVIPNGVDVPPFRKIERSSTEKTALFLSRIHPIKGVLNLVEAWSRVRPEGWKVIIAGIDECGHEEQVKRAVSEAGLQNIFTFIGPVRELDKWEIYRNADLFILPSFSENFGLVIAEALASGVPVITTTGTPWSHLVEGGCGWWVSSDVDSIANAIADACAQPPEMLQEKGLRGRIMVKRMYSWPNIAKEMKLVYEWMLGGGQPPGCIMFD